MAVFMQTDVKLVPVLQSGGSSDLGRTRNWGVLVVDWVRVCEGKGGMICSLMWDVGKRS